MKFPMKLEWQLHYSDRIEDSFSFNVLVLHRQWSVMKKETNVVHCGMMVEYVMEDCFFVASKKCFFSGSLLNRPWNPTLRWVFGRRCLRLSRMHWNCWRCFCRTIMELRFSCFGWWWWWWWFGCIPVPQRKDDEYELRSIIHENYDGLWVDSFPIFDH